MRIIMSRCSLLSLLPLLQNAGSINTCDCVIGTLMSRPRCSTVTHSHWLDTDKSLNCGVSALAPSAPQYNSCH